MPRARGRSRPGAPWLLLLASAVPPAWAALYVPAAAPPDLNTTQAIGWPDKATRTAAVQAAISGPFAPDPAATVFTCALMDIGVSQDGQLHDPFAGYAFPMATVLAEAVAALPFGSSMSVAATDLDGVLVRVLLELQSSIGFTLQFVVAKPPLGLLPPLISDTDDFVQWAFNVLNASCVLWPMPASPTRRLYFRQTVPVLTFGYSVVTTRADATLLTTVERVFLWTKPFSPGVWCLLMTACVTYALAMPFFEGADSNDFANVWNKPNRLVGHAIYLGAMGPSKPDTFEPSSGAGRAAAALNAFALLLIISTYTANLAAQFATVEPAVQDVSGIRSFSPRVSACVRSSSTLQTMLNFSFPAAAAAVSPNNTFGYGSAGARNAMLAVLAGACEGAIVPQTEAAWVMGVNDTGGELCGLEVVGEPEGDEALPFTFSKAALSDAHLAALDMAIEELQREGDFIGDLQAKFFPAGPRAVCAQEDAQDAAAAAMLLPAQQVGVIDLAGAFLLQAIGLSMGFVIHSCKHGRRRVRAWRAGRKGAAAEAPAAADTEEGVGGEELTTRQASLEWVATRCN